MADELVRETPQFRVEQPVPIDDQRIGKIGPAAIARRAQRVGFMQETEGPRGRDVAAEIAFRKRTFEGLFSDRGTGKLDFKKKFGLYRRQQWSACGSRPHLRPPQFTAYNPCGPEL